MSNGAAPSCPISRNQQTGRIITPRVDVAATLPKAHDLRSVITVINRMNSVVQHVTRGAPQINNVYPAKEEDIPAPTLPKPPQYGRFGWQETSRGYKQQHVVNADDETIKVPIKTLSYVTWTDTIVGHHFRYSG